MRRGRVRASPGARGCAASRASVRARIGGRHAIPRRRSPFDFTVLRVVAWVSCPHRSPDRRSPLKCTAFRVIAERAIHSRIGAAVRSICRRSPSECTAFRVVMGGFYPQPNRPPHSLACRCSPSELTGFLVCGCPRGAPHLHASAPAAPAVNRASRAAHRCGQSPPPNRLAILCIRPVSVAAASAGSGQAGVDIRPPDRLAALWI